MTSVAAAWPAARRSKVRQSGPSRRHGEESTLTQSAKNHLNTRRCQAASVLPAQPTVRVRRATEQADADPQPRRAAPVWDGRAWNTESTGLLDFPFRAPKGSHCSTRGGAPHIEEPRK